MEVQGLQDSNACGEGEKAAMSSVESSHGFPLKVPGKGPIANVGDHRLQCRFVSDIFRAAQLTEAHHGHVIDRRKGLRAADGEY